MPQQPVPLRRCSKNCERATAGGQPSLRGSRSLRQWRISDFISCDPALNSTLSHGPPSVSLTVESRGGRHGRKRLQDHRNRWHQPHLLGEAAAAAVRRILDVVGSARCGGDRAGHCHHRRQDRGLPRAPQDFVQVRRLTDPQRSDAGRDSESYCADAFDRAAAPWGRVCLVCVVRIAPFCGIRQITPEQM